MSVISRIESMMEDYSSAEKKLANYIIGNIEKVPTMTANELAEASGLSAPTVVRFSKKIGFQSLTDFKITISTELQTGIDEGFSDIEANESFYSIKNKLGNNAQVAIKETVDILEEETIQKVVECLESAETVFLYGVGASSLVVEDILQKWSRVGKPIIFEKDIHVLLPQLVSNEKKKVLWLVSNSGRSADVVALAELAKSMNIEIIALTQFGNNPLSKIADVLVQTSRPKEITNRSAATNSLLAQFATIDIIFYFYMAKNEKLSEKVKKTREAIQESADTAPAKRLSVRTSKDVGFVVKFFDRSFAGTILFSDQIRPEAAKTIKELRKLDVKNLMMITGDGSAIAQTIAEKVQLDSVHARSLPQDKLTILESIPKDQRPVAMVGDGVNDAPALAAADISNTDMMTGIDCFFRVSFVLDVIIES
ncbi:hypothetical protein EfmGK941_18560 [Enterococcus faecium]|nr:hypothetical protein EfmGK941_18560 [Enterococcus faecium]